MRAIVTGATGYIGGKLLSRLLDHGMDVGIVVRNRSAMSPSLMKAEAEGHLAVHLHSQRTEELVDWVGTFSPDVVFHLAASSLSAHRPDQLRPLLQSNIVFGTEMLEATSKVEKAAFITTGTFWEYGLGDDRYRPTSLYAATKRAFRDLLEYFKQAEGLRAVELKLFDVYGPDDPRGRLIDLLLDAQAGGEPLALSPGEQQIDLVHVDDVVDAYLKAAEIVRDPGVEFASDEYAVSSGVLMTIRELVARLETLTGQTIPIAWGERAYRPREVMKPWRGEALPGWRPQRTLDDGLAEMIEARRHDKWQCA